MSGLFTAERGREAALSAQSDEAKAKRQRTLEVKKELMSEDILTLAGRGLDPAPIALRLQVPITRVVDTLREAGVPFNPYAATYGATPEPDVCPHCGKEIL